MKYYPASVDHTIRLGLKNYPKLTPHMSKFIHWVQRFSHFNFLVSWFVQWRHHWIGHNDPSYATICQLVPKLWKGLLPCQLICTVTWPLDRASKTTPNWPLAHLNPTTAQWGKLGGHIDIVILCNLLSNIWAFVGLCQSIIGIYGSLSIVVR